MRECKVNGKFSFRSLELNANADMELLKTVNNVACGLFDAVTVMETV